MALCASPAVSANDIVSLRELPYGSFVAPQPSTVTRDGTVIGVDMSTGSTLRWLPGQAPENLGGGPTFNVINITPVVNPDGSAIVANYMRMDGDSMVSNPRIWEGIFGWAILPGMQAISSLAMGISADGSQVVGYGGDPEIDFHPWTWNEDTGQHMLPIPVTATGGEAWGTSNDGRIVAGFVSRVGTDQWGWPRRIRYGARWVDGQIQLLQDNDGHALGQVVACTNDCSILIGGGYGGEPTAQNPNSGRAWYWTESEGAVYLDTSGLPAGAVPPYYAMGVSEDGSVIIGTYTVETETPIGVTLSNRPFRWTRDGGAKCLIERMTSAGISFGGDGWDLVPNSVSPDGRMILLNGQDPDYQLRSGVLTLIRDGIFSNGFED
jgi:hypothetical protein